MENNIQTQINIDNGIAIAKLEGNVSQEELLGALFELRTLTEQTGIKRQMIDLLEADMQISVIKIYNIPKILREYGHPINASLAVVSNGGFPNFDFFRNVLLNQGSVSAVEHFDTINSAINWLK
jgi:hypothetical protein